MEKYAETPNILNEPIFQKAFGTAALVNLTAEQRTIYELSLIQYRDMKSAIETAVEEAVGKAVESAIEETQIEIARNFILLGLNDDLIIQGTGLSLEIVVKLRNELKK